jgi:hypothetical protein
MLGLVVALLALAAVGLGACSGPDGHDEAEAEERDSPSRNGELALVYGEDNDEAALVRIDPQSLRPVDRRRLDLGRVHGFPTFSPDGRLLAFTDVYSYGQVQVVDVDRLRTVARLDIGEESLRDPVGPLGWLDDQLLAVAEDGRLGDLVVTLINPFRGSVDEAGRIRGPAWVLQSASSARYLVLLVGRPTRGVFRATELAVADSEGRVRTATLTRIPSGLVEDGPVSRSADPALAVDEDGDGPSSSAQALSSPSSISRRWRSATTNSRGRLPSSAACSTGWSPRRSRRVPPRERRERRSGWGTTSSP